MECNLTQNMSVWSILNLPQRVLHSCAVNLAEAAYQQIMNHAVEKRCEQNLKMDCSHCALLLMSDDALNCIETTLASALAIFAKRKSNKCGTAPSACLVTTDQIRRLGFESTCGLILSTRAIVIRQLIISPSESWYSHSGVPISLGKTALPELHDPWPDPWVGSSQVGSCQII